MSRILENSREKNNKPSKKYQLIITKLYYKLTKNFEQINAVLF